MNDIIAPFIKYLEEQKLLVFDVLDDDPDNKIPISEYDLDNDPIFDNEVKLQKYVYLAKRFGLNVPYKHTHLQYGPHSDSLANDYFDLAENRPELYDPIPASIPKSFRSKEFLKLVKDRDREWLEIATSLIFWNEDYDTKEELVEIVRSSGGYSFKLEYVLDILEVIKLYNLVNIKLISS
jgi:uncharacterized protein YwgA